MKINDLPRGIDGGKWNSGHVQGIAVDVKKGFVYYSFTTVLAKTDLLGNLIGYAGGLVGHLGCIDINPEDGKVYGSLEFKNDAIGQGIFKTLGKEGAPAEDAFYVAIFDVDKITRPAMDAEKDGIMTAVWLPDVVEDYNGKGVNGENHRYGCSGIDGTSFGPVFGAPADSPSMLMICYGVYRDLTRTDNDYQVILQYDWRRFAAVAKPLTQEAPHHSGVRAEERYFFFTGNTTYGVQNLLYDPASRCWCVAVYVGKKPEFSNYSFFLIDGTKAPVKEPLRGMNGEEGPVLSPAPYGEPGTNGGAPGFRFPRGTTGIHSLGDGYFYISHEGRTDPPEKLHTCHIHLYQADFAHPECFRLVEN